MQRKPLIIEGIYPKAGGMTLKEAVLSNGNGRLNTSCPWWRHLWLWAISCWHWFCDIWHRLSVNWSPSQDQCQSLVSSGHLQLSVLMLFFLQGWKPSNSKRLKETLLPKLPRCSPLDKKVLMIMQLPTTKKNINWLVRRSKYFSNKKTGHLDMNVIAPKRSWNMKILLPSSCRLSTRPIKGTVAPSLKWIRG